MDYILAIDVGTSSLRSIVYDLRGKVICRAQKEYHSEFKIPSYVEQDPRTWKEALIITLKNVSDFIRQRKIKISAISVTSQRASVIPVNDRCEPLDNAIMWQDKRSFDKCGKIQSMLGEEKVYRKTGLRIDPYFSLPKMLWLKEERPDIFNKAYKLLGVQDFIIYQLTNLFVTDWTQGSRTMLMNIENFSWDEEILKETGIKSSILCELVPPGSTAGYLTGEMAGLTGLTAGVPVIISGGDQQCAAVALNILQPGHAEANTGTGSFIIAYSEKPVFDRKRRTLCSAAAVPGKWVCEAGMFTTGAIYRWFKEQFFGAENKDKDLYTMLNEEIRDTPLGSGGVLILPHFEGSAAPYWNPLAKGVIFNLTLGTKRADIARAILEGICLELADNLSIIEENVGSIDEISVAGGLTRFDLFNQMQADAFNKPVIKYQNDEASSLGASIVAAVSLGCYKTYDEAFKNMSQDIQLIFKPEPDNTLKFKELVRRKNLLYEALNKNGIYDVFKNNV
jgi:glycerol kinase